MHSSLFLILFATACLGSYTCCAAGQIARSSDGWSGTIIQNLVFAVHKPTKNMASFSVKEGNRAALSTGATTRFPSTPYDTPRVSLHNNPKFHVDRTHAAGGVCEQTKTALQKYI